MIPHIVVLGGGSSGTLTANVLARRLHPDEATITVIDATGVHAYQPGFTRLALGTRGEKGLVRDMRRLLQRRIRLIIDEAVRIDPVARTVYLRSNGALPYDRLIIATGSHLDPAAVPGLLDGSYEFYSLGGARRLRETLADFNGGDLVVGVAGMPYSCPPAPASFTFLLEEQLRKQGLRKRTRVHFTSPIEHPIPIREAAELVTGQLAARDIELHTFFNVVEVDAENGQIHSLEGAALDYDLAVLIPPHRGAPVVADSGLGDPNGWVPTDPSTLRVRGFDGLFAIGDATDLPISKAGSTAHFEAPVVAEQIVARFRGRAPDPVRSRYDGRVMCFLEVGGGKAAMLAFDYERPIRSLRPSRRWHLARKVFDRAYWATVPRARF